MLPLIFGKIIVNSLKPVSVIICGIYPIIMDKKSQQSGFYRPDGRLIFVIFHVVIPLIRQSYNVFIINHFSQ